MRALSALLIVAACTHGRAPLPQAAATERVVSSADGRAVLALPLDAVDAALDVTIEPVAGPAGVASAYRIEPAGLVLFQRAVLRLAAGALAGDRGDCIVWIGPGDEVVPLATRADVGVLETDLDFLGTFGIGSATPVADADDAQQRFLDTYLPALGAVVDRDYGEGFAPFGNYAVYGPFPLADGGTVVATQPATTFVRDEDDGHPVPTTAPREGFTASGAEYFFWVDLVEGGLFGHPTLYVMLDGATGRFRHRVLPWHPTLDGEEILFGPTVRESSSDLLFRRAPEEPAAEALAEPPPASLQGEFNPCDRVGVLISFTGEAFYRNNFASLINAILPKNPTMQIFRTRVRSTAELSAYFDALKRGQEKFCRCQGFEEVFVYVVGHGNSTSTFSTTDGALVYKDEKGKTVPVPGSDESEKLPFADLLAEITKLCLSETGRYELVVDACHTSALFQGYDEALAKEKDVQARGFAPGSADVLRSILCYRGTVAISNSNSSGFVWSVGSVFRSLGGSAFTTTFANRLAVDDDQRVDLAATLDSNAFLQPLYSILQQPRVRTFHPRDAYGDAWPEVCKCPCTPPAGALPCGPLEDCSLRLVNESGSNLDLDVILKLLDGALIDPVRNYVFRRVPQFGETVFRFGYEQFNVALEKLRFGANTVLDTLDRAFPMRCDTEVTVRIKDPNGTIEVTERPVPPDVHVSPGRLGFVFAPNQQDLPFGIDPLRIYNPNASDLDYDVQLPAGLASDNATGTVPAGRAVDVGLRYDNASVRAFVPLRVDVTGPNGRTETKIVPFDALFLGEPVGPPGVLCSRVIFINDGPNPWTIRIESSGQEINGGQRVTIPVGESFREDFNMPLEKLNFAIVDPQSGNEFDQGFQLAVPCGKEQVFQRNGGAIQFRQVDIDATP